MRKRTQTNNLRIYRPNCDSTADFLDVSNFPTKVGRAFEVDLRVNDMWASRQHCEIDIVDGKHVLRDLGARHGTFVNGKRIGSIVLHEGDEIGVGMTVLVVVAAASERRMSKSNSILTQLPSCDQIAGGCDQVGHEPIDNIGTQ